MGRIDGVRRLQRTLRLRRPAGAPVEVGQRQSRLERLGIGADGALEGRFRLGAVAAGHLHDAEVRVQRRLGIDGECFLQLADWRPRSSRARRARWPAARWRRPASAPSPAPCRRARAPARTGVPAAAAGRRAPAGRRRRASCRRRGLSSRRPPGPSPRLEERFGQPQPRVGQLPDPCRRRCGTRAPPRAACRPSRSRRPPPDAAGRRVRSAAAARTVVRAARPSARRPMQDMPSPGSVEDAARAQQLDEPLDAGLDRLRRGVDHEVGVGRRLVRRRHAREVAELAGVGAGVDALRVAGAADLDRRRDVRPAGSGRRRRRRGPWPGPPRRAPGARRSRSGRRRSAAARPRRRGAGSRSGRPPVKPRSRLMVCRMCWPSSTATARPASNSRRSRA